MNSANVSVRAAATAAMLCALTTSTAHAQSKEDGATYNLAGNTTRDIATTAAFTATWMLAETALKEPLSPQDCHWCSSNSFDAWAREGLKWNSVTTAAKLSDVGLLLALTNGFGGLAWAAAADHGGEDFAINSLYVLQTVSFTMTFTNVVKVLVARQRPAIYYDSNYASHLSESEQNLSFFSGHAAFAFAFASAASSLASLRGYRHARWVWAAGLSIAAFTAYARIGADAHYTSDVLIGSAVGAGLGGLVPRWLHARTRVKTTERSETISWQPTFAPLAYGGGVVGVNGFF